MNTDISNAKGELARAASAAKEAANKKAELDAFNVIKTEYDRLSITYLPLEAKIEKIHAKIDLINAIKQE